ncbi:TPA: hypothetical protein ACYQQC_002614 [Clostridium botulinum]
MVRIAFTECDGSIRADSHRIETLYSIDGNGSRVVPIIYGFK